MPVVEQVRIILECTFGFPVLESNAQIVLDRLTELARKEAEEQIRAADICPLCPECQVELHLTTAGDHVCRNEACRQYR